MFERNTFLHQAYLTRHNGFWLINTVYLYFACKNINVVVLYYPIGIQIKINLNKINAEI